MSGINPGDIKKRRDSFASAFHIQAPFPIAMVPGESIRSATAYLPIGWGGRCGVTARPRRAQPVFPSLKRRSQKLYLRAICIWRMLVNVEVITPKFDGGATLELPPQLTEPGVPNSTWFGALNISTRS